MLLHRPADWTCTLEQLGEALAVHAAVFQLLPQKSSHAVHAMSLMSMQMMT
jgi:hypothetical protein